MNISDLKRNAYMLRGSDAKRGYMRWWHSFQGVCPTTQETRTFFVEYSILNPALGAAQPILGQPSLLQTARHEALLSLHESRRFPEGR